MLKRLFLTVMALTACLIAAVLLLSADIAPARPALAGALGEPQWGTDIQVNPRVTLTPSAQKNFSLAINPTDPNMIIGGYSSSSPSSGLSAYAWSTNAGRTWGGGQFTGPWGGGEPMTPLGDANVAFDARGVGYYSSIAVGESTQGYFVLST